MGRIYTTIQFISHFLRARRWDAFHSPYLFRLFIYCCDDQRVDPVFSRIESRRKEWMDSSVVVNRKDFGAGSVLHHKQDHVHVSRIAKHSLSLPFQCRFVSRLAAFANAGHVVELGTSLGIASAYLSIGAPRARIDTVEGDPEIAAMAKELMEALNLKNVHIHISTFNEFISAYEASMRKIDVLFLDGDHRLEATLQYYYSLKPYFHPGTIVVVDDIYWSKEMTGCWKALLTLPEVTQSVDCFHFGLLFFNTDFQNKEHHIVNLPARMMSGLKD